MKGLYFLKKYRTSQIVRSYKDTAMNSENTYRVIRVKKGEHRIYKNGIYYKTVTNKKGIYDVLKER